jgi:uncharacterized protein YcbX
VALAFGNNVFSYDLVSQAENRSKVTATLSDFLGRPVQLECQMGERAHVVNAVAVSLAAASGSVDPLVEYAVTALGAEVIE